MIKSHYGTKDLLELKSSRSTISRASSDRYSGYSLITNESCVKTSRAKVFMVATITCVIAIIVIVILVVTRIETEESPAAEKTTVEICGSCPPENECENYIIVGGGLAGAYTAWRMRQTNTTIHLYEKTSRVGGKLLTNEFPGIPDAKLEMGLPYYMPRLHTRINNLISSLGLTPEPYYGTNDEEELQYYTRGRTTEYVNLTKLIGMTYFFRHGDSLYPRSLLQDILQKAVAYEVAEEGEEGSYSNDESLRTALLGHISTEGYNYIKNTVQQLDFQDEANAAEFVEYLNDIEDMEGPDDTNLDQNVKSKKYTIKEGMQTIVQRLLDQAAKDNPNFQLHLNTRLTQIETKSKTLQLSLTRSAPEDLVRSVVGAQTYDTMCAKKVILALPPKDLSSFTWEHPMKSELQQSLDAVESVNGHVVYLLYNGTLLDDKVKNDSYWVHSDLPVGEVKVFHAIRNVTISYDEDIETTMGYMDNVTTAVPEWNTTMDSNRTISINDTNTDNVTTSVPEWNTTMDSNRTISINDTNYGNNTNITTAGDNPINSTSSLYINVTADYSFLTNVTDVSNIIDVTDIGNVTNVTDTGNFTDFFNVTVTTEELTTTSPPPTFELQPVTIIRAVFSAREYYHYWKSYLHRGTKMTDFSQHTFQLTDTMLERIHLHLSQILELESELPKEPLDGFIHQMDVRTDTGPLSYVWKPGHDWGEVSSKVFHPDSAQEVYIVGQAYAASYNNMGIEGDLQTVDKLDEFV